MAFYWTAYVMKIFFLNLTRIIEANAKIYLSIIFGIALCLLLYVAEAVHVQNFAASLNSNDQQMLREAIQPITERYALTRYLVIILSVVWSSYAYISTKKKLGL